MSSRKYKHVGPANIDLLLKTMIEEDASDLFITVGMPPSLKVNGLVRTISEVPLTQDKAEALVYSALSEDQAADFERNLEANFALAKVDIGRFRVNVFQQQADIGMVIRRIKDYIPTVEELLLPVYLKELAMAKRGLVLVVGATSSGKSTTLAAMIGHRNQHSEGHIVSIEDPVEFIHQHRGCIVTQREVGIDTHSYDAALKNTLRQAPDVIMIGEIRSRETMEHAIAFAETGHLVVSTLHATNSHQALDRIINFFPEERRPQLLMDMSMHLKAVVAQRLVPSAKRKERRVAIEILLNSPLVSDLILRGETHLLRDLMKKSGQQGMRTFDQAMFELYKSGDISEEDAVMSADSANEVRLMIKLANSREVGDLASGMDGVTFGEDDGRKKRKMGLSLE